MPGPGRKRTTMSDTNQSGASQAGVPQQPAQGGQAYPYQGQAAPQYAAQPQQGYQVAQPGQAPQPQQTYGYQQRPAQPTQQPAQQPPQQQVAARQAAPQAAPATGAAPRQQATPAPGASQQQSPKQKKPHKPMAGGLRAGLIGAACGVVGAGLLVLVLTLTGVIGGTKVINTTNSAAGRTVNITSDGEDTSVAKAVAAKDLPSVVSVYVTNEKGAGLGSGVILDTSGNIITNYHVVNGADDVSVNLDGKSFDATVVGTDASSDIAVIHADFGDTTLTPMEIGDSDQLVVGDWVMSIGSPFGLDQSVSSGVVSSLARNTLLDSSDGQTIYTNLIQVDAAINPGNSGEALVNDEGKLVGICTLFSSDTESFAGIGFAIPGNYAMNIANQIISGKTVEHAYIGLSLQTVNSRIAKRNNLSVNQGAYVSSVTSDGPADKAGIKVGDVITAVNGEEISSADGMILAVRSHNIGDTITVTVVRDGESQDIAVTLGSDNGKTSDSSGSSSSNRGGSDSSR